MTELKPCPFCGWDSQCLTTVTTGAGMFDALQCQSCGAQGPYSQNNTVPGSKAVRWNTRAAIAAIPPRAEEWRLIESAPKDEWIIVWMPTAGPEGRMHAACNRKIANGHSWVIGHQFGFDSESPTHWQPLPSPPATKGEGE
jgi:hypothetical protein